MNNVNLNVQGISSASCIEIIKGVLSPLDGVQNIHVDWESGRVQVERKSRDSDDLIYAINAAGYRASLDLDEQTP
jgi:copper chaperone CopZ